MDTIDRFITVNNSATHLCPNFSGPSVVSESANHSGRSEGAFYPLSDTRDALMESEFCRYNPSGIGLKRERPIRIVR